MKPERESTLNDGVFFSALEMLHCGVEMLNERVASLATIDEQTYAKLGVASLFAGVEQLLKFRLQETHWSLVFADLNKATLTAYYSGDFKSVEFGELVQRLRSISHCHINKEDAAAFETLRRLRNRGMHYNDNLDKRELAPLYSRVLSAAIDFASSQVESKALDRKETDRLESLRRDLHQYKEFAEHRLKHFNQTIDQRGIGLELVYCPTCRQETLLLGDSIDCGFCGARYDTEQVVEDYEIAHAVWGLGLVRKEPDLCSKCGTNHLFEEPLRWFCFTCKITWDKAHYAMCEQCANVVDRDDMNDEQTLCERCMGGSIP